MPILLDPVHEKLVKDFVEDVHAKIGMEGQYCTRYIGRSLQLYEMHISK